MATLIITGLTLKEAVRRKTLLGVLVLGLLILGLSLLLIPIHANMVHMVARGRWRPLRMAIQYPVARSLIAQLCLSSIKSLGALFAALLAGGAISGEIERGVLAVILARPIYRWQILLGKWIGINLIVMPATILWVVVVWASLTAQTHADLTPLLRASPLVALFPLLVGTLTLSLSTFSQRVFGTAVALTLCAFAWFDGIFLALSNAFQVGSLETLANVASLVVPQGAVGWWIEDAIQDIMVQGRGGPPWKSPQLLSQWGAAHLHFARLDAVYLAGYVTAWLVVGTVIFTRRDAV